MEKGKNKEGNFIEEESTSLKPKIGMMAGISVFYFDYNRWIISKEPSNSEYLSGRKLLIRRWLRLEQR